MLKALLNYNEKTAIFNLPHNSLEVCNYLLAVGCSIPYSDIALYDGDDPEQVQVKLIAENATDNNLQSLFPENTELSTINVICDLFYRLSAMQQANLSADMLMGRITSKKELLNMIKKIKSEEAYSSSIIFSRVKLWTDEGDECQFFVSGSPTSADDIKDDPEFEDFIEFLSCGSTKDIIAYITTFSEGDGDPQPASQAQIETEKWKLFPDDPKRKTYDGQRTAQEVFDDLETHLTSIGYLPDEYFLFDRRWENGREFPSDGYLTTRVDYGGSEGIYLDITLEYHENGEHKYEHFATGKTLGESGDDLDRMNLIASAITKAFHEDGMHARYIMVGGSPAPEGVTMHLNPEEREVMAFSLTKMREVLCSDDPDYIMAGKILNRLGGKPAVQEQKNGMPTQGIIFSRVQLCTDTGEEADFYMPGIPRGYDDLEDYIEFIDFTEFISTSKATSITAIVTPFSSGGGAPRDASQADIDRINKLDTDCDPQIAYGWFMGEKFDIAFDYDVDELFNQGMGGIE